MADWEQLDGERAQHYSWFLAYRNLGPSRSLDRAYQVMKGDTKVQAPGPWATASSTYRWVERAHAWDVHVLSEAGAAVVTGFVATLRALNTATLRALQTMEPKTFAEAMEAVQLLGSLIPAETVEALQQTAAAGTPPALGSPPPPSTVITIGMEPDDA